MLSASVIDIEAPQAVVWESVRAQRVYYDTRVLPIKNEVAHYYLIQTFKTPLGNAQVKLEVNEVPYERLDFHLIDSSSVKVLSGYWLFTKTPTGTRLRLVIDELETKVAVPRFALKAVLNATVKMRLEQIKKHAERR